MIVTTQTEMAHKATAVLFGSIATDAAHLVAALYTPESGVQFDKLSLDAADGLQALRSRLDDLGYLCPYKRADGVLSIW